MAALDTPHHRRIAPAGAARALPGGGRTTATADLLAPLEPGSWIDELKLSAEYGISRTPLREALKVLAVEGLVTMKVRRGAYVTEMSRDDVSQVYHLLALLESDAAAEVARRRRRRAAGRTAQPA
jgi:DNA-binding GntR family transcriptional regulator